MKVLNLQCGHGHGFEGWFGSEDDFQSQTARGLLVCPLCGDATVHKMPSAPRLNLSGSQALVPTPASSRSPVPSGGSARLPVAATAAAGASAAPTVEAMWMKAVQHVMANTEDVGPRFAEEARRIHYGETEHRNIRGQTSPDEAKALTEEGIETFTLPIPAGLKGPTH